MSDSYRALVALPSARRLLGALATAWLSFGGVSLVILLTVRHSAGSFAAGGAATAGFAVGSAVLAPARGRLVDRRGGRVLPLLAGGYAVALLALAGLAWRAVPVWALVAAAVAAGASAPPLVASTRAAWSAVVDPGLLRRAYAVTSVVGDAASVGVPALAGAVCVWSPTAALALCAGAALVAASLGARFVRASPAPGAPASAGDGGGLATILVVSVALGASLGVVEVTVPAAASGWHAAGLSGVLLGAFGVGSVCGGLLAGRLPGRSRPERRYLAATLAIAAGLLPPLAAGGPGVLAALLVVAGVGYGPATVALFETLDGQTRLGGTEALTWITTAEAIGAACGAAGAGVLVGHVGPTAPFALAAVVLGLPALAALAYGARSPSRYGPT